MSTKPGAIQTYRALLHLTPCGLSKQIGKFHYNNHYYSQQNDGWNDGHHDNSFNSKSIFFHSIRLDYASGGSDGPYGPIALRRSNALHEYLPRIVKFL